MEENDVYFVVPTEGHFVLLKSKKFFLNKTILRTFGGFLRNKIKVYEIFCDFKMTKFHPKFLVEETSRETDTALIIFQAGNGNVRLLSISLMSVSPKFPFRNYGELSEFLALQYCSFLLLAI